MKSLENQLNEECKMFAQTIELERHRGINLTPIYKQIEEDLCTRYNVNQTLIKSKVLNYQLEILKNE